MSSPFLKKLQTFPKFGEGVGFYRLHLLLEKLECLNWLAQLPTIQITGSKGKGSTCALVASILQAGGWKVGRFISPHLFQFHERICVNQIPISESALNEGLSQIFSALKMLPNEQFGAFELFVVLAILYFKNSAVDFGVIEAGIGGRLDSTRVFSGKVGALTSIELEHTELLGNTLELIGYDKLDLFSEQSHIVCGNLSSQIWPRLVAYSHLKKIELHSILQETDWEDFSETPTQISGTLVHSKFVCKNVQFPYGGHFQKWNIQTAVLAVYWALKTYKKWSKQDVFYSMVKTGLGQVSWEGRFQKIATHPDVFIDVAHTRESIKWLRETISQVLPDVPILLLLGVSTNKNKEAILEEILPIASELVFTQAYHKGTSVEELQDLLQKQHWPHPVKAIPVLEKAVQYAMKRAKAQKMTVFVAGSLFLSVEVATFLRGHSPQSLHFF